MSVPLSDAVKALIAKAQIIRLEDWQGSYPAPVLQCIAAANGEKRYLTDADLEHIQQASGASSEKTEAIATVKHLRDEAPAIVDEARAKVLETFPKITQPGGGLYPAERAEACWRDFWHFLRCITYGIATHTVSYTSPAGMEAMQLLYRELRVPLEAMIVGLEGVKTASLNRVDAPQREALVPYFDHLIEQLRQFS